MAELKDLYTAVVDMQEDTALDLTKKYLEEDVPALDIFNCYQSALEEIGKRFEQQVYFIPELIMAGEMMKTSAEILKPKLAEQGGGEEKKKLGKILIATVESDIHDIGKNIVTMMMDLNGLEVKDIGVDIPADKIISEAREFGAGIIGLSGLLTLSFDSMKSVVDKLKEQGIRDQFKVLIGGGQMDERVCDYVGADAFVTDALQGVSYAKGWLS
ncbi:MAG: cobalamin-dependent protein [Desulfobacteraceae bacterium]|nr:cobalamin-dependent protein [Desulfobacteraceae bacterium]